MEHFFTVKGIAEILDYREQLSPVPTETIDLFDATERVAAVEYRADCDLPGFSRSTMDGFAVNAASTFGASDGNPAFLSMKGTIAMGDRPDFSIGRGEAARISTGGMLPEGADSVVMLEYAEELDQTSLEVYRSVAPGQNMVRKGEDFQTGEVLVSPGCILRPQEVGLLAAFGCQSVQVFSKPSVGIVSTGDEVVPIDAAPDAGKIRDVNSYSIGSLVREAGATPVSFGIVQDDFDMLLGVCRKALAHTDMLLISGGSSVGMRDLTVQVLEALPGCEILAHGISISPGKPTILAKSSRQMIWGLPGHVVSAMVVFQMVVRPFLLRLCGRRRTPETAGMAVQAFLSRNLSSAQGRTDYVRVRLVERDGRRWAEPILGKSALINTMVKADGLIAIDVNTEGLEEGTEVSVIPF